MSLIIIPPRTAAASGGNPGGALALWGAPWQETGFVHDDPMATVKDFSGNARDFTQSISAMRPHWQTNILNGQPGIFFDGVMMYASRTNPFFSGSQEAELICVIKLPSTPVGNGAIKFDGGNWATHWTFGGTLFESFGTNDRFSYTPSAGSLTAGTIHHVQVKAGTNNYKIFQDGNNTRVTGTTSNISWANGLGATFLLGASATASLGNPATNFFHGWFLDLRIFNRNLTAAERNAVMTDINARHGISYTAF